MRSLRPQHRRAYVIDAVGTLWEEVCTRVADPSIAVADLPYLFDE